MPEAAETIPAGATLAKVPAITPRVLGPQDPRDHPGETGGDAVTMSWLGETTPHASATSWHPGYLIGTLLFAIVFIAFVAAQIRADRFRPWLYWATIIASTTVGTTLADFADRSLGIGYAGGSALLLALLLGSLWLWKRTLGTVAVDSVSSPQAEWFYWITILFSQTLGTALGDWSADSAGLGYGGAGWCFARCSRWSPLRTTGPGYRAPRCSGPRSSSPARWARSSATSSTSPSTTADSRSAVSPRARCWSC